MDDVFIKIGGRSRYLWRAVDQDGSVLDILVQSRRSKKAAARFFTEKSHQSTRQRESRMRGFKSPRHAQRFLSIFGMIEDLFNVGRHLLSASSYRAALSRCFVEWRELTGIPATA